ncbi:MAG: ABA4-like family protein [Pseudomonadota bacterium]
MDGGVFGLGYETIFSFAGNAAMLGWALLIFLPRRFPLLFAIPQFVIPFGLGLAYAALILPTLFTIEGGGFGSLEQVKVLFGNDATLLAGWLHYLAFDLFIGAWIARRADEIGLPRLIQAPILIATLMFGPVGLVMFLSIRSFFLRGRRS